MKRTNLIFTHAAVFSVGIASALIVRGFRDPQTAPTAAENARASHSGTSAFGGTATADGVSRTKSTTAADEARTLSKRDGKSPVERMGDIVRITDPVEIRFSGVEMNPANGGRSRG